MFLTPFRRVRLRERLGEIYRWLDNWTSAHPKRLGAALLALALAMTLWHGAPIVPMSAKASNLEIAKKEDAHNLYYAAKAASWRDAPGWFVGRWIYPDVGYYRPLTSVLFLAEQRLFDRDLGRYNLVSLALHASNAALLFLLAASLFGAHPRARYVLAALAVYGFVGPRNSMAFGVGKCLHWFPAQNDILSLTFALGSLLALDRFFIRGRRGLLVLSLALFYASVGSKEMGFIAAPMALLLIYHRRGFAWKTAIPFILLAAGLWVMRKAAMATWDPPIMDARIFRKLIDAWGGPVLKPALANDWGPVAGVALAAGALAAGLWKRAHIVWVALGALAGFAAGNEIAGEPGSWATILLSEGIWKLCRMLLYLGAGFLALRHGKREPLLLLAGCTLLCFLPILNFGGQHYFYWPGAFLALANAALLGVLPGTCRDLAARCPWRLEDLALRPLPKRPA